MLAQRGEVQREVVQHAEPVLADPDAGLGAVRAVYAATDLRVPPVVTSMAEPGGPPIQVTLR